MPSVISITITAPSMGWFISSTTLPLTPPVWAAAELENAKRPSTTAQIRSDPRLKRSPIIGNLRLLCVYPRRSLSLSHIGDEILLHRAAAGAARIDGAACPQD